MEWLFRGRYEPNTSFAKECVEECEKSEVKPLRAVASDKISTIGQLRSAANLAPFEPVLISYSFASRLYHSLGVHCISYGKHRVCETSPCLRQFHGAASSSSRRNYYQTDVHRLHKHCELKATEMISMQESTLPLSGSLPPDIMRTIQRCSRSSF